MGKGEHERKKEKEPQMSAVGTGGGRRTWGKGAAGENGKRRNECRGKVVVQVYLTYRSREFFGGFFSLLFTCLSLYSSSAQH